VSGEELQGLLGKRSSKPRRPNKYAAERVEVDGLPFDSKKEARRYGDLVLLRSSGEVVQFARQVSFPLEVRTQAGAMRRYVADFVVLWREGTLTIEDTKGFKTREYELKRDLFHERYAPWRITEL